MGFVDVGVWLVEFIGVFHVVDSEVHDIFFELEILIVAG